MGRGSSFVKYVVVPIVCGLLGFYWLGPYLGRNPKTKGILDKASQFVPNRPKATASNPTDPPETPATPETPTPEATTSKPSGVSVEVHPVPDEEAPRHRRRRRSSD